MDACQGEAIALPSVFSVCQARNVDLAPSEDPLSDPSLWHLPDPTFITSCTNFPGAKTLFKLLKNKHVRVGNGNAPELGAESRDRRQLSCWEGSGGLVGGSGGS